MSFGHESESTGAPWILYLTTLANATFVQSPHRLYQYDLLGGGIKLGVWGLACTNQQTPPMNLCPMSFSLPPPPSPASSTGMGAINHDLKQIKVRHARLQFFFSSPLRLLVLRGRLNVPDCDGQQGQPWMSALSALWLRVAHPKVTLPGSLYRQRLGRAGLGRAWGSRKVALFQGCRRAAKSADSRVM